MYPCTYVVKNVPTAVAYSIPFQSLDAFRDVKVNYKITILGSLGGNRIKWQNEVDFIINNYVETYKIVGVGLTRKENGKTFIDLNGTGIWNSVITPPEGPAINASFVVNQKLMGEWSKCKLRLTNNEDGHSFKVSVGGVPIPAEDNHFPYALVNEFVACRL